MLSAKEWSQMLENFWRVSSSSGPGKNGDISKKREKLNLESMVWSQIKLEESRGHFRKNRTLTECLLSGEREGERENFYI